MRADNRWIPFLVLVAISALAGALFRESTGASEKNSTRSSGPSSSPVFTPAHRSLFDAVKDFFDVQPGPVQPVAYTHKVHLANGMQCTDCHTAVEKGPLASIPSVKLCMTCHGVIAKDHPEIKKIAAYFARGEDIPWQRVYGFTPSAHVKFNHAPHIQAKVACQSCHGEMRQQTVAVRAVNLTMAYCVDCHKLKKASIDCTTCHF